jgi:hypothetical protein
MATQQPSIEYIHYGNQYHVDYLKNTFRDFARANLYKVEFILPITSTHLVSTEMTVKSVNLPSFDIGKLEIKRCGERVVLPTTQNYGDLQMTILCDDRYSQRKLMHSWVKRVVYDTDTNIYHPIHTILSCKIRIRQLDNKFNTIFTGEFNRAWPVSIGEVTLSSDNDSQLVEFPATFSYSTYTVY